MPDIHGVVFDMDGLLLDTERLYLDAFRATLKTMNLPSNDDLFLSMVGSNTQSSAALLAEGLGDQAKAFGAIWDEISEGYLAKGIPVKPGVEALITALKDSDTPYIIATSTRTDRAFHHLDRAGIGGHFPDIIGGDQVARSKPAPDIFLTATRALGLAPERCVGFEDSANGVKGLHAAGLIPVQVLDVVPPTDALRALGHHIATDLVSGARHVGLME